MVLTHEAAQPQGVSLEGNVYCRCSWSLARFRCVDQPLVPPQTHDNPTNANKLKKLVLQGDRGNMVAAMKSLTEAQRAEVLPEVLQIFRTVEKGSFLEADDTDPIGLEDEQWFDAKFLAALRNKEYAEWRVPRWTASIMLLGFIDEATLRDPFGVVGSWLDSDLRDMAHRVLQVLDDRRPSWLQKYVTWNVRQRLHVDCPGSASRGDGTECGDEGTTT